jgi:glycosyltransferase involved in cell wall biosynthesis
MHGFGNTLARSACDALADGAPLAALQAHSDLLLAPRGAADLGRLRSLIASGDRLARSLAIRPLARFAGSDFDRALSALAGDDDPLLREQALWALADRPATPAGITAATGAIAEGGHAAMLAQLTIERWATSDPAVLAAIPSALPDHAGDDARVRLVETATVADHAGLVPLLTRLLRSTDEPEVVRAAAARGLAARPVPMLLDGLWRAGADGGPELRFACARALLAIRTARADEAAAALATAASASSEPFDRLLAALVHGRPATPRPARPGLRIAQIFVQGRLDGGLQSAGAGDGGGISTLLVHLGRALGSVPEIASVVTIARALAEPETGWGHTRLSETERPGVSIERIPFGPSGYLPAAAMWEHRLELERALETAISELGGVDVAHLRFADAGAFAAARVCRRLGIPVAFTAAPDPHGVIDAAERRGELTRETFPAAELTEHYLFRAQLVADLLGQAKAVVVLPRPRARTALRGLIGTPFASAEDGRVHTIAEGISLAAIDDASSELTEARRDGDLPSVANVLLDRVIALPQRRHGLPLLVSVGRLHRVKGLPLLLEAWAGDDDLHRSLNLVIVGGDLEQPTPEETTVLGQLEDVCARIPRAREGLVLLGHRANREVATVLRVARAGLGSLVGPRGVYACTSQKEEFGVALLEAMATGLAVVAPDAGGPATYVREGLTGSLADTSSIEDVKAALRRAAAARADEPRARRTSNLVRSRYTIEAMAASLAGVYADLVLEPARVAA